MSCRTFSKSVDFSQRFSESVLELGDQGAVDHLQLE